MKQQCTIN